MKYVVKMGGASIENKALLHACGKAIFELVRDGNQVAVVHGGGKQLTRVLAQMGKKSEFVSGLRVTDAETRDAALMVLAGRVNKSLVAALRTHGQSAMGLAGGDGNVFRARKKKTVPDLGFVGEIAGDRSAVAGGDLEDGRGAGDLVDCAGVRWRVLQHQRRRDGCGVRDLHQGRRAGVSDGRSRREGSGRRGDALALAEGCAGVGTRRGLSPAECCPS